MESINTTCADVTRFYEEVFEADVRFHAMETPHLRVKLSSSLVEWHNWMGQFCNNVCEKYHHINRLYCNVCEMP